MMCITNDDAISNGSKCNNVMRKRKCLKKDKENQKEGKDEEVVTIEERNKQKLKNN
jgi:hypothetical protein